MYIFISILHEMRNAEPQNFTSLTSMLIVDQARDELLFARVCLS